MELVGGHEYRSFYAEQVVYGGNNEPNNMLLTVMRRRSPSPTPGFG